jgi:hypothetical protein
MKILALVAATLMQKFALAGPVIGSEYPSGTNAQAALERCQEISYQEESGVSQVRCPMMAEAEGYAIELALHEHGAYFTLRYNGETVVDGFDQYEWNGQTFTYYTPDLDQEVPWFVTGVKNGVFEFRYQIVNGVKQPYALIYRDNFYVIAQSLETGEDRYWTQKSALVVIALQGQKSRRVGVIDSILAEAQGLSGNVLARQCADSLIGAGDPAACSH